MPPPALKLYIGIKHYFLCHAEGAESKNRQWSNSSVCTLKLQVLAIYFMCDESFRVKELWYCKLSLGLRRGHREICAHLCFLIHIVQHLSLSPSPSPLFFYISLFWFIKSSVETIFHQPLHGCWNSILGKQEESAGFSRLCSAASWQRPAG